MDMMISKLDAAKKRLHIEVTEDVTSTNVGEMRKAFLAIIEGADSASWKALYLDLRSIRMIDSMGVNWLYAENVRLKEAGKELVLRISSPAIYRVMEFAGLDKVVTLKYRRRKQTR